MAANADVTICARIAIKASPPIINELQLARARQRVALVGHAVRIGAAVTCDGGRGIGDAHVIHADHGPSAGVVVFVGSALGGDVADAEILQSHAYARLTDIVLGAHVAVVAGCIVGHGRAETCHWVADLVGAGVFVVAHHRLAHAAIVRTTVIDRTQVAIVADGAYGQRTVCALSCGGVACTGGAQVSTPAALHNRGRIRDTLIGHATKHAVAQVAVVVAQAVCVRRARAARRTAHANAARTRIRASTQIAIGTGRTIRGHVCFTLTRRQIAARAFAWIARRGGTVNDAAGHDLTHATQA